MGVVKVTTVWLLFILLVSCARYVWYNPTKTPEQTQIDLARCKLEAKKYALGVKPANPTVVNINVSPDTYSTPDSNVVYLNSAETYTYGNPYLSSYFAYGFMIGMMEAEYMKACMQALGYKRIRRSELKELKQRANNPDTNQ